MTYLHVKFYSSKMPQLFKASFHHATTNSMWHCNLVYRLQQYGLCLKLWWNFCSQLLMLVFWTKVGDTSYSWMHCCLLYWLVGYLGRTNIPSCSWQPCGRGFFDHELREFVVHMTFDKFWKLFHPLFPFCIHLIGKRVITCWFWCLIQLRIMWLVITFLGHENDDVSVVRVMHPYFSV
jgi:hypothetical protein